MADIYDQHSAAFRQVSAFVIMKDGERVATVAFKFPADGAGRLYAYVHFFGLEMVRGYAGGGGYDKRSAAVADAARKIKQADNSDLIADYRANGHQLAAQGQEMADIATNEALQAFMTACEDRDGRYWDRRLEAAGYMVFQAV